MNGFAGLWKPQSAVETDIETQGTRETLKISGLVHRAS